ncbi:MAG: hypothetical protein WBH77_09935 [Saccharofermentanales bacterium]
MRWNISLELIKATPEKDEIKQEIKTRSSRTVRANEWGISWEERLAVGTDRSRGSLRFEVLTLAYKGETEARYKGKLYCVDADIRGGRTILTLTELN